jgi:hypothetical protein
MKLEDLVPSIETCKALKEAGFKKDTLFYWTEIDEENFFNSTRWKKWVLRNSNFSSGDYLRAPTLAEIELNSDYIIKEDCGMFHGGVINIISNFEYVGGLDQFDSEIEARAALWLYLNKE